MTASCLTHAITLHHQAVRMCGAYSLREKHWFFKVGGENCGALSCGTTHHVRIHLAERLDSGQCRMTASGITHATTMYHQAVKIVVPFLSMDTLTLLLRNKSGIPKPIIPHSPPPFVPVADLQNSATHHYSMSQNVCKQCSNDGAFVKQPC